MASIALFAAVAAAACNREPPRRGSASGGGESPAPTVAADSSATFRKEAHRAAFEQVVRAAAELSRIVDPLATARLDRSPLVAPLAGESDDKAVRDRLERFSDDITDIDIAFLEPSETVTLRFIDLLRLSPEDTSYIFTWGND